MLLMSQNDRKSKLTVLVSKRAYKTLYLHAALKGISVGEILDNLILDSEDLARARAIAESEESNEEDQPPRRGRPPKGD